MWPKSAVSCARSLVWTDDPNSGTCVSLAANWTVCLVPMKVSVPAPSAMTASSATSQTRRAALALFRDLALATASQDGPADVPAVGRALHVELLS